MGHLDFCKNAAKVLIWLSRFLEIFDFDLQRTSYRNLESSNRFQIARLVDSIIQRQFHNYYFGSYWTSRSQNRISAENRISAGTGI